MEKDTKESKGRGQPSKYTEEIAEKICKEIATTSKGLSTICKKKEFPCVSTVMNWLNDEDNADFLEQYARAREAQADLLADEIIEIADTPEEGIITRTDKDGNATEEKGDMLQHRKLKVDARKWKASKLAPKKYGDRLQQDVSIHHEPPLFPDVS